MAAPLTRMAARLGAPNFDGDLLARFVQDRDEVAFAALVHRHGPTVFGVCRRVLGNTADAEDAFQAVFLVLVNRADSLIHRTTLGDWLHAVAVRTALKARTAFARLRKHERVAAERRPELTTDPPPAESWLDRELAELPDHFRAPVVLCLVQERPRAEAAAELGIPEGTLASRLDTARKRLANRLARYRAPLVLTGLLVPVPAAVADGVVSRATDGAGVAIHQLALEVSNAMTANTRWPALVAAGILTAAIGGLLLAAPADRPVAKRNAPVTEKKGPKWKQEFDQIYRLKDDELVKIIPKKDWPECRKEFLRDRLLNVHKVDPKKLDDAVKEKMDRVSLVADVDAKGKLGYVHDVGGLTSVNTLSGESKPVGLTFMVLAHYLARIKPNEIDDTPVGWGKPDAQFMDHADFVVRSDAPREKLIPAIDAALKEKLDAKFKVEWYGMKKDVWVASGKPELKPRAWRKAGQVDVYSDETNVNKEKFTHTPARMYDRPGTGTVKEFLDFLNSELFIRAVWGDGDAPEKPKFDWTYHWFEHRSAKEWKDDRDPEKVLKNVSEQTGLTFKMERRDVPMLVIRER